MSRIDEGQKRLEDLDGNSQQIQEILVDGVLLMRDDESRDEVHPFLGAFFRCVENLFL